MVNKLFVVSGSHIFLYAKRCLTKSTQRILIIVGVSLPFIVCAAPTAYTLNNDSKSQVISVFDCTPGFSGKAALGDNKYVHVWECENNSDAKYAIYKTSYTSRYGFAFSSNSEVVDFFTKYLAKKASSFIQNTRMSDAKYVILSTSYSSKESAYADYFVTYKWDGRIRMAQQGRFMFQNGYIADWSVTSLLESGVAADEFNGYVKYFKIKQR
jgi:hypothetical protein